MKSTCEGFLWTHNGEIEGLPTAGAVSGSSKIKSSYDVIVIGSGFAGLIAARDLSRHTNASVLLLEARDRIGGRTWTANVDGEELEMGGTWVHWNQPHIYSELHRYDLHKKLKTSAGSLSPQVQYYKPFNGNVVGLSAEDCAEICQKVADRFFQIDGLDSHILMPYPHDPLREPTTWKNYDHLSVKQRLDYLHGIPQHEKDIFEAMTNSFGSATGADTGFVEALRWYALGGHNMARVSELAGLYKLGGGGMSSLAVSILNDFGGDLCFGWPVSHIDQKGGIVTVTGKSGRAIRAKAIICTIPLNCLDDITFDPPLNPVRKEAVQLGHINKGAKIHFKLSQVEDGWFATCHDYPRSPFVFGFSDHNGTKATGPDATWCIGFGFNGHLTDKKDYKHIIEEFKKNIKPDADVLLYATHDWMNDPYAKGAWSCWGPNSMSKYLAELQKPHGRIFFASADWADGWRGFIDGAVERGQKAARDVTNYLPKAQYSSML